MSNEETKEHLKIEKEQEENEIKKEEPIRRRSVIDLSLGLESITTTTTTTIKVKRGSIDLSLGLEHEKNDTNIKPPLPPSILKYGLEKQVSNEINGYDNENINLSPELLSLLQTGNEAEEAWEVKADVDHKISHNDEVINAADILSKLGFSEGVNVESETWETKAPTQHSDNNLENTDANDDDDNDNLPLDETKVLGLLGITNDQDVGEAWEKKTHKDDPII